MSRERQHPPGKIKGRLRPLLSRISSLGIQEIRRAWETIPGPLCFW